ncbi:velvet complex subunit B [Favolaschia claudopus]|uniref:Velvet complex subunit B n=1 Tax=Favolaschia claudopus TaxID=2862362 RepID=A0AAW0ECD3_9AGAR
MIQHISPRKTATAIAPMRQSTVDGPEQWGKWVGRNYYSLEMVQHPLRARMCGFGDKDRRPLAPAAVARMVIKRDDNSIVDVDDVDCSFFVVTVDLWSEDGKHERNLVLHPSSGERYVPVQPAKPPRRRGGSTTAGPSSRSGHQTPISRSTPTPFRPANADAAGSGYGSSQGGYFPAPPSPIPAPVSFTPSSPYGGSSSQPPTWGYHSTPSQVDRNTTYPPPILPSIHSFGRTSSSNPSSSPVATESPWNAPADSEPTYRPWGSADTAGSSSNPGWGEPGRYSPQDPSYSHNPGSPPPSSAQQPQYDPALFNSSSSYSHSPQVSYFPPPTTTPSTNFGQGAPSSVPPPIARAAYTRTLVGPLSSNGYRLLDEHRKPGIFFLFQDLSVRTEGTFRLRLRLMNVGALPAPEPGALQVHTNVSPVLAQIFTEPFTVFSAKRFPGVPETTALSIAFGNQGLKLPLRNRHGSSKRRRDDSGSDDDSDGG